MISLDPARPEERLALDNLFQLYAYDWSAVHPLDVADDGRFEDYPLDPYFSEDGRHPFLIRVDGKLGGFALVTLRSRLTGAAGVADMAEFFVMRRYRKTGVGRAAACAAFDRFRGPWEVRQRPDNVGAISFWRRVIAQYTKENYQYQVWNDAVWRGPVQRFLSG